MPESTAVRTKRDLVLVISDLAAAHSYTVAYEPGDFTWSAPGYSTVRILDRGEHVTPRRGDAQPCTLGFSTWLRDVGSATYATLPDICQNTNYVASTWSGTLSATSDEVAFNVAATFDGTFTGEADKTLTFSSMSLRGSGSDGDPSTYSVTGEGSILAPTLS